MLTQMAMRHRPRMVGRARRRLLIYAGWGATVGFVAWLAFWALWSAPVQPVRSVDPSFYLREPVVAANTVGAEANLPRPDAGLAMAEPAPRAPSVAVDPDQAPPDSLAVVPAPVRAAALASGESAVQPPATDSPATAESVPGPPLIVQAILTASDRRLAVVDDRVVGPGDTLGAYVVLEVQADGVIVEDGAGATRRLPLGH